MNNELFKGNLAMKPSQVSANLRRIATLIDKSKNPKKHLVARDLKRVVIAIQIPDQSELKSTIMEGIQFCSQPENAGQDFGIWGDDDIMAGIVMITDMVDPDVIGINLIPDMNSADMESVYQSNGQNFDVNQAVQKVLEAVGSLEDEEDEE